MATLPPVDERTRRAWVTLHERELLRQKLANEFNVTKQNQPFRIVYGSNHKRNRYTDVLPYDRTLVSQKSTFGYLNANIVCDLNGRWFVASQVGFLPGRVLVSALQLTNQGPTDMEMRDWFEAIHQRIASRHPALPKQFHREGRAKAAIIVQLSDWREAGRVKASQYLPYVTPLFS